MPNEEHNVVPQLEPIVAVSGSYYNLHDRVYFPINHKLVRDLLGRLLTQLDVMNLSDRAHSAAKSLTVREVWRWWSYVCDNAVTAGMGCLAPVVVDEDAAEDEPLSNRWGWKSEQEWHTSLTAQSDDPDDAPDAVTVGRRGINLRVDSPTRVG